MLAVFVWSATAGSSSAQAAATALSSDVFAMAAAIRAGNQTLVYVARARQLHAEAAKQEIENSRAAVDAFWENRRKIRDSREAEHIDYLERQQIQQETRRRILRENLETGTDLSDELNWMLSELLAAGAYSAFASDGHLKSVFNSPENLRLSANDQRQIRLSEGKVAGGGLVFTLDPNQILEPHWTHALEDDRFDRARSAFEEARELALADLRIEQQIRKSNGDRLLKSVSDLVEQLESAWPRQRRKATDEFFFNFLPAKRCLERLEKSAKRLITSNNPAAYDDSYRIKADTVANLLRDMMNKGLEFAPPEPGGEVLYKRLFMAVRAFYKELVP